MLCYDVVIVGSGPAGLYCAEKLIGSGKRVALIDVAGLERSDILRGFGGAGTYSDGKFDFTEKVGGYAHKVIGIDNFNRHLTSIKNELNGRGKFVSVDEVGDATKRASEVGLELVTYELCHLGTDGVREFIREKYEKLKDGGIDLLLGSEHEVRLIFGLDDGTFGVSHDVGKTLNTKKVVLATGRAGSQFVAETMAGFGITPTLHKVDIGFRVEIPHEITASFTDVLHDIKLKNADGRTFCVCPQGEVVWEVRDEGLIANGQSYLDRKTGRTNMAILTSLDYPESYGRAIIALGNSAGDPREISDIGDFLPYNAKVKLDRFMEKLDQLFPGIKEGRILFPEVKTYGSKFEISEVFETGVPGLFTIGDCSGYTRNIVHAAISGCVVGEYLAHPWCTKCNDVNRSEYIEDTLMDNGMCPSCDYHSAL